MTTIEKIYDNTKDGKPNYRIDTTEGKVLYCSGVPLYPVPKNGDKIKYDIITTKTSANGNQYTSIKNVEITDSIDGQNSGWNSPTSQALTSEQPTQVISNGMNKSETQRMDIFVTGIVGRAMGSGQFSVHDITELTKNAVSAFNENLKEL